MYCGNCGAKLDESGSFCGNCGSKAGIRKQASDEVVQASVEQIKPAGDGKKKKKTGLIIGIAATVLCLMVAGGAFAYINYFSPEAQLDKYLELGQKYLQEENYVDAIVAFEKAIKVDDKCVEAYIGLADAYLGTGDVDKAIEVLEKGYAKTKNEDLIPKKEKIESTQNAKEIAAAYADVLEDIIDQYGICKEKQAADSTDCSGLAYAELIDFNADGTDELYLYYIYYDFDRPATVCMEELWYFDGAFAKKALDEEHYSTGAHISDDDGRAIYEAGDGKVHLVTAGEFLTGMGEYGTTHYYNLSVYEFTGTSVTEKGTLNEIVGFGKRLADSFEIDDKVYYEYELNFDGERSNDAYEVGVNFEDITDTDSFAPDHVIEINRRYSQRKGVIHAGSYIYLSWEINDVQALIDHLNMERR